MATNYTAVVQKRDPWWIGWVEEVPGVNSQGATREELLANLQSALQEALEMNRVEAKASHYIDTLRGERQRSAVLAIHVTWLDHSSSLARAGKIEPQTPLDLLLLYEAAAATFQDGPAPTPPEGLPVGGRVINRRQAAERLSSVADEEIRLYATIFASRVIALSSAAAGEQDLDHYLELFLTCIRDKAVIGAIRNGAISVNSDRLSDPDYW